MTSPDRSREALTHLRPPLKNWRFWVIQGVLILIILVHETAHGRLGFPSISGLSNVVPLGPFLLPVLYAALTFDFIEAVATAGVAIFLAVLDAVMDVNPSHYGELGLAFVEIAIFAVLAVLIADRISAEKTARANAEAAEKREHIAKERYRELFESSDAPSLVLDEDGTIVESNSAAAQLFWSDSPPLPQSSLRDAVGKEVAEQIIDGNPANLVTVHVTDRSELVFRRARSSTIGADGKRVVQVILQDVTQERIRNQQVEHYAHALLRGQEEERRHIAQELHDQPVQTLIHLCRTLDGVRSSNGPLSAIAELRLREARRITEETIEDLRQIAQGLRPPALDDLGLAACLERLVADVSERTGIPIEFEMSTPARRLSSEVELELFRIAQEALSNVQRHADAKHVFFELAMDDAAVSLTVGDDGVGFTAPVGAEMPDYVALGLTGMRERAELVGGHLEIRTAPGEGTRVRALVPVAGIRGGSSSAITDPDRANRAIGGVGPGSGVMDGT